MCQEVGHGASGPLLGPSIAGGAPSVTHFMLVELKEEEMSQGMEEELYNLPLINYLTSARCLMRFLT